MPNKRDLRLSEYDIGTYAYRELHNFCLQYPKKKTELLSLSSPYNSPQITGMPHAPGVSDPTGNAAVRAAQLSKDTEALEQCAMQACPDDYECMILCVTEDVPHHYLKLLKGLETGRDKFYKMRRYFYYLLAKRKNIL